MKRGHRLVADDCVEIRQEDENTLVGTSPELIEHLLEIRGLGIIDVMTLFGAGAVLPQKKISLVINLGNWDQHKQYDRLGLDEEKIKIIDTEVTKINDSCSTWPKFSGYFRSSGDEFPFKTNGHECG